MVKPTNRQNHPLPEQAGPAGPECGTRETQDPRMVKQSNRRRDVVIRRAQRRRAKS
jgi:hypothetical protein